MADSRVYRNALPAGTMLQEYRLDSVLGSGGFGITYLGWDTHLEKHVAIKEYLPVELSVRALDGSVVPITSECEHDYKWGLDRFILEARTLAKFSHPHIVRAMRFLEANATGYMVMEYEKGEPLNEYLKREQPNEQRLKEILMPLLDGLQAVHAAGFLHRDIKPGNIFLREAGSSVLIDFGAARHAIGGATKSLTSVITPGYAPLEQYASDGHQGPWSDIYALGGVLYRALTNENPPDAVSRMKNDTVPAKLAGAVGRASPPFLRAVEWALAVDEKRRPQSIAEWRRALLGGAVPGGLAAPARPDLRRGTPDPLRQSVTEPVASNWGGAGFLVALIIAIMAIGYWMKYSGDRRTESERVEESQRAAELKAAQEEAERAASERRAAEQREAELRAGEARAIPPDGGASNPAPAAAAAPSAAEPARERPSREREGRPESDLTRRAEAEFRAADANGDGYLERSEAERFPVLKKEFQRVDTDGDGRLSPQEFQRARETGARRFLRK